MQQVPRNGGESCKPATVVAEWIALRDDDFRS